ncbi:hypothetical protein [Metaplanococcus flavidus]|uniref:DUF4234 domain-containing protein n=1 Tax=Metaplanococcus flavidus TaxID=569883 RepID=A0ABW3L8X9_9BACL
MVDIVGWIFVALTIVGFGYALVWQVRDTLKVKRSTEGNTKADKRRLAGHYLMVASLAGFYVSYLVNVSVGLMVYIRPETVQPALINSNTSGFACFAFLAVFLIAMFWVVPKEETAAPLLKSRI